jgi:hypothetical protein
VRGGIGFVKSGSAVCCRVEHRKETDMYDMIGASGMVRGWAMVWHLYAVWLPSLLVVSVAASALVESVFAARPRRLPAPVSVADRRMRDTDMRLEPR